MNFFEKDKSPITVLFSLLSLIVSSLHIFTGYQIPYLWFLNHADFQHFTGNIIIILIVGSIFERHYGISKTLILYLLGSFIGYVMPFIGIYLIGASGHVFAFLGASLFIKNKEFNIHAFLVIFILSANEIMNAFKSDNISQSAHIFGLIIGIIYGKYLALNETKN